MNEDAMATEKTAEGIRNFTKDTLKLEMFIAERPQIDFFPVHPIQRPGVNPLATFLAWGRSRTKSSAPDLSKCNTRSKFQKFEDCVFFAPNGQPPQASCADRLNMA